MESCGSCGQVCGPTADAFVDAPISMTVEGVKYYYLYDGLGSITEVIDSNEDVVNTYRYSPFGESLYKQEQVYNPYQYTGRRYDEESGLYYYRARMYSPEMSRFTSNDPAREGANMYAYVGNIIWNQIPEIEGNSSNFPLNPTGRRDPSGKMLINPYLNILFQPGGHDVTGLLGYQGHSDFEFGKYIPEPIRGIPYPGTPVADYIISKTDTCIEKCDLIGCKTTCTIISSGAGLFSGIIINYACSNICKNFGCRYLCWWIEGEGYLPAMAGSGNYPGTPPDQNYGYGYT